MRLFAFLILLTTTSAFADCFTTDLPTDGSFTCPPGETLYIDTPLVRRNPDIFTSIAPLDISADNVVISANITLDGEAGSTDNTGNKDGGLAGPGASNGGSIVGNVPTSGGLDDPQDGDPGASDPAVCASGAGGGGGQFAAGSNGLACVTNSSGGTGTTPGGTAGLIVPSSLIGGYGGGAGGKHGSSFDVGTGGGGGGAIRITATVGTITIANNVRLSARGGKGGNSIGIGGAGGGGGGGFIHLISPTAIVNQGIFDVRAGDGGSNTSGAFPHGGHGGRGGNGLFILEENSIQTPGSGLQDFTTGSPVSSSSSLKSDISCGAVAKKNDNQLVLQMMLGFVLSLCAAGAGGALRKRRHF